MSGSCRYLLDNGAECPRPRAERSDFCAQHALPADLEVYRAVTDHFKQDLTAFWVRSNFYLIVQAGLLSTFVALVPKKSHVQHALALGMAGVGLSIGVVWFIVARGAVAWIRRWRNEVMLLDRVIDRHRVYDRVEAFASTNPLKSPSNVTQYLPLLFCAAWVALIVIESLVR
jgi:hypothetical protein